MENSAFAFPEYVWLKFYVSGGSSASNSSSRARLVSNSEDAVSCIQYELEKDEFHYMEAESYGYQCFYRGALDADKVLLAACLVAVFVLFCN